MSTAGVQSPALRRTDTFWRGMFVSGITDRIVIEAKWIAFCNGLLSRISHLPQVKQDEIFTQLLTRNAEYIALARQDREALKARLGLPRSLTSQFLCAAESLQ